MTIDRIDVGARMSQAVVHSNTVYLAGQCGNVGQTVAGQTETSLGKIDRLLAEAGSDKSHILQAVIWLADINDYAEMNEVWDAWVSPGNSPARACGQTKLAGTGYLVEIIIIAAINQA